MFYTPKQIQNSSYFMGSKWANSETETIARNIVTLQLRRNAFRWTPFTWEEYRRECTHSVTESEQGVLEALVNGGKPVFRTTAVLESGYLTKNANGQYMVTEKFVEALPEHAIVPNPVFAFVQLEESKNVTAAQLVATLKEYAESGAAISASVVESLIHRIPLSADDIRSMIASAKHGEANQRRRHKMTDAVKYERVAAYLATK